MVTRESIHWIHLGPAKPIDEMIATWREAITSPPYKPAADIPAKLRELVWAKVRAKLPAGTKVVYISPDQALSRLPWAALPGDKPGTIVLEEFAIAIVPHGPFLLEQLTRRPVDSGKNPLALIVGGVPYDDAPGRDPGKLLSSARGEPPLKAGEKFAWKNLPGAEAEARGLDRLAKSRKIASLLLTGASASSDRVLAELPKARYAQFATHGFFADPAFRSVLQLDPKLFAQVGAEKVGAGALSPMVMSGLVLAGANRSETPGRGLVTGEHLIDRDLSNLELAVLSACDTGLGESAGGEGVFGLQRAFHYAGCRNVVATLWKVDDMATAALMGEFYRYLWEEKLPATIALQRAQLAVYRADAKQLAVLASRGPVEGDQNFDGSKLGTKIAADGKNPPVLWAAFTLSGTGK